MLDFASGRFGLNPTIRYVRDGDMYFVLLEGLGLGARTVGGFHGNADDADIDVYMLTRVDSKSLGCCKRGEQTCAEAESNETGIRINSRGQAETCRLMRNGHLASYCQNGQRLGNYGTDVASSDRSLAMKPQITSKAGVKLRGQMCRCEFEGMELLCADDGDASRRASFGGSWWVPPIAGGKDTGWQLGQFFDPDKPLWQWRTWALTTMSGSLDIILARFSHISQLRPTPHALSLCAIIYSVSTPIGC